MKTFLIVLAAFLAAVIIGLFGVLIFWKPAQAPSQSVDVRNYPPLVSADGHLQVDLPHANGLISSPVAIEGNVIGGGWFFEASFPIKVLDGDGAVLGSGTAQALSDWTSTGTVPFSASVVFTAPHSATGTIVFVNDNPSGLPANQKSLSVPVEFK